MKYVCIAIHSTAQCKYWNFPNGWTEIVKYLNSRGYVVKHISKEYGTYMDNAPPEGVEDCTGKSIPETMTLLKNSELFIGISSGLSWLSWGVGTPTVIISGFSAPFCEPKKGVERVFNPNVCNSCFNDHSIQFDPGDWNWCPRGKDFECSKSITPEMVIESINNIFEKKN